MRGLRAETGWLRHGVATLLAIGCLVATPAPAPAMVSVPTTGTPGDASAGGDADAAGFDRAAAAVAGEVAGVFALTLRRQSGDAVDDAAFRAVEDRLGAISDDLARAGRSLPEGPASRALERARLRLNTLRAGVVWLERMVDSQPGTLAAYSARYIRTLDEMAAALREAGAFGAAAGGSRSGAPADRSDVLAAVLFGLLGLSVFGGGAVALHLNRQYRRRAAETRARRTALGAAGGTVFTWSGVDDRTWFADEMAAALGVGAQDFAHVLESWSNRLHPEDHQPVLDALREAARSPVVATYRIRHGDGAYRWWRSTARPMPGGPDGTVVVHSTDLTDLVAARIAAEDASRMKSDFLANMSHEIRTPLNGVLGLAQVLAGDDLTAEQRSRVDAIIDSGRTLMAVLNDVLDLSKIEAGRLEIAPIAQDLRHTLNKLHRQWLPRAEEKGLALELDVRDTAEAALMLDPVRVTQCVANLVSNAVKFTRKGSVRITVDTRLVAAATHVLAIEVRDSGVGMDEEAVANLFRPFAQGEAGAMFGSGGTGLGLTITRRLARLMGGDVTVESDPGVGSVFTLTLTADQAVAPPRRRRVRQAPAAPPPGEGPLGGRTILLVDDNQVNRTVASLFLKPTGARVVTAVNGREALDRLHEQAFDLVLMDVHMPVMDGRAAVQWIRECDQPWSAVPVIALTADAMSGDRERLLAAGMTGYVSKPIDVESLMAEIERVLEVDPRPVRATA